MKNGYSIIEVLVSILIFSIIVGTGMGVFVSAIKLQKYNLTHQQILEQASYAAEYMSRTIRMAQRDDGTCLSSNNLNYEIKNIPGLSGVQGLMFKDSENICRAFFFEDDQIKEYEQGRSPEILDLTSSSLEVLSLDFFLVGQSSADNDQPITTFFIEIRGKGVGYQPRLKIQTSVSQRNLDI